MWGKKIIDIIPDVKSQDKENRKNTFRKFKIKNVEKVGTKTDGGTFVLIEDGILPDKWESSWDAIGKFSPSVAGSFGWTPRPNYSNHSKGWAANGAHFRT